MVALPPEVPQRPAAEWKVSLALLLTIMCACATLNVILDDLGWWFVALLACGAVLGTAALVRLWVRIRVIPPVAAALVLFGFLTQQFAAETTIIGLIPTFGTLERFGQLFEQSQRSIENQTVPAEADGGILFLVAAGIGLVALAADIVAIALRRRALVGILVLVVLWIPVFTVMRDFDLFWVMLTLVSFMYLLRADAPVPDRRLSLAIGGGALVVALVAQAVLPTTEPVRAGSPGTAIRTGDSPIVNLGNDLRRDVERRALTYTTESDASGYLRLASLDVFDGDTWSVSPVPYDSGRLPQEFGAPPGLSPDVEVAPARMSVQIANLDSIWLPLPYPTQSVNGLAPGWSWDPATLTLKSESGSTRGEDYAVASLLVSPTPEQLLDAGSTVPSAVSDLARLDSDSIEAARASGDGDAEPVEIPAIIGETAREVAGDAGSIYEQGLALQQFLRAGEFVYSELAPVEEGYDGTGLGVIATFLAAKSGYCVHFASAMALMARSLGIPARVAVGFLPGDRLPDRLEGRAVFEVTSHDLHAWPELYFDGVGWLPFEPTTSRGVVPDYADTEVEGVPAPTSDDGGPEQAPEGGPAGENPRDVDAGDNLGIGESAGGVSAGILWLIVGGLLALLVAASPAAVRWTERRMRIRTVRRGFAPAAVGWRELLQTAEDVGIRVPSTATPREAGRLLVEAIASGRRPRKRADELLVAGSSAVQSIVDSVEREGYARPGSRVSVDPDDVALAVRRVALSAGWRARLLAVLVPPSLWQRAVSYLRPGREGIASLR